MTRIEQLKSLIARVEAHKSGTPTRRLADEILLACGWTYEPMNLAIVWSWPAGKAKYNYRPNPLEKYAAAKVLLPAGYHHAVANMSDRSEAYVGPDDKPWLKAPYHAVAGPDEEVKALVLASLRAHLAIEQEKIHDHR